MAITGFDPARNFAIADLASGINSAATSLTLVTGQGALFPVPGTDGDYNIVIYNSTDYPSAWLDPDVEIARVTDNASDVLDITRAQEGTSASNHNTGGKTYSVYMTFSRKAYDDLVTAINTKQEELSGLAISTATVDAADKVLIQDDSDSDNLKTVTAQSIADLAGATSVPDTVLRSSQSTTFTDDLENILVYASAATTVQLFNGSLVQDIGRKYNGGTLQSIATTSLLSGSVCQGAIVSNGVAYVYLANSGGATFRMYSCPVTSDISNAGNWTRLTLSGAVFSQNAVMCGFDGTDFWFSLSPGSVLCPANLSGTTVTQGSSVSVTGMTYGSGNTRVNSTGIYAAFGSAPTIRLADLSGSLVTDAVISNSDSIFVMPNDVFVAATTTTPYNRMTL